MNDPLWPGVARFGVNQFGEAGLDESIEGPVRERPTHRENSSDLSVRSERLRDREPVGWALGEDSEDGELGERQLMGYHRRH